MAKHSNTHKDCAPYAHLTTAELRRIIPKATSEEEWHKMSRELERRERNELKGLILLQLTVTAVVVILFLTGVGSNG